MATSAFKSTTKRTPIRGSSSSEDSSCASHLVRRSRSLSRFSRPFHGEPVPDYNRNGPRGKFVNTVRGSAAFPETSLDDLALEFFGSSSRIENETDGGSSERKGREGRSIGRGRWASDTASSRRRGRSVSRSHGDSISSNSSFERKKLASSSFDTGSRRRRSLSVARHQTSDSESEVDCARSSRKNANVKGATDENSQMQLASKTTASSNKRLGRSCSHKVQSLSHDGYSSHSSVLTDDESKDTRIRRNGIEKIIHAVYAQNKLLAGSHKGGVANDGLYEAMQKEHRHAVQEIHTKLNQAMGRNQAVLNNGDFLQSVNSMALPDLSDGRKICTTKIEQAEIGSGVRETQSRSDLLETRKQNLLTEMLLEEQQRHNSHKIVKELSETRGSAIEGQHSRASKCDKYWMSKRLTEEAERYFDRFISNVDTDISSLDGERSDGSSTLGGKERDASVNRDETYSTAGSISSPVGMDGVNFPWLLWETSHNDSLSGKNKTQIPLTPKYLHWDSEKDPVLNDPSSNRTSSHGSWTPAWLIDSPMDKIGDTGKTRRVSHLHVDMGECHKLPNNEEVLFEIIRQRNRINSGSILICSAGAAVLY